MQKDDFSSALIFSKGIWSPETQGVYVCVSVSILQYDKYSLKNTLNKSDVLVIKSKRSEHWCYAEAEVSEFLELIVLPD